LDPNPDQIKLAAQLGVDRIELYTGPYAAAWGTKHLNEVFERHKKAANLAQSLGIGVNAGHDLNLKNIQKYTSIQNILEVSIGHALTVEALYNGITKTIKDYKTILSSCQHQ
jgi:pyridoxine 5-phosphate synthase